MTDATTTSDISSSGWGALFAAGLITVLLGLFLLIAPAAGTFAVTLLVGIAFLVGAIFQIVGAFTGYTGWSRIGTLVLGAITGIAGLLLITNPLAGAVTLTAIFIIWLLVDGAVSTIASLLRRPHGWGWWLASGMLSLLLGLLLLGGWPASSLVVIGIYAGIVLLFRGMILCMLAFEVRAFDKAATAAAAA